MSGLLGVDDALTSSGELRFAWWNVHSYAHFDATRRAFARWPSEPAAYEEKSARIDRAFEQLIADGGRPHLIGLAEITKEAADGLRDRVFPGYGVCSLDFLPGDPSMEVAWLYSDGRFEEQAPIAAPFVPRGTRPMAVVDFKSDTDRVRFIACHWTARFDPVSAEIAHSRIADELGQQIYEFLHESDEGVARHVVVVGDFNTEPFGMLEDRFCAARNRARATAREHYTDQDVHRVRLYNCSWRMLGESSPHAGADTDRSIAGTYYYRERREWRTYDQLLISGGLLSNATPYLREERVRRVSGDRFVENDGHPHAFDWNGGQPRGVSDHLPLVGAITLNKVNPNV